MGDYESDPGWQYLRLTPEQMMAEQAKCPDPKKHAWVPDEEDGFVVAEIKSTKGDLLTLMTPSGKELNLKKDQTMELNPAKFHLTEDMSNLSYLSEATVLHNLRSRYFRMLIYTYSGLFCVVINPYKRLPIYTESCVKMFMGRRRNEMPPHLFAAADEAYRNMLIDHENQSMLITGESGAGKTENTKKVISYFATVGASQSVGAKKAEPGAKKEATLEEQIVQTNPVLEAFGNAKTVRNNNSSRFGKFIRSHFSRDGKLAGGDIEHYLLEKSRVIRQAPGERCYHVFYQIMSGQVQGLRDMLKLSQEITYYHFVSQAELTIDGVNDKEECQLMEEAFDIMGFSQEEKDNLYKVTAGIMHMGEMKFKQRPREEQAEVDTKEDATNCAEIWQVAVEDFLNAFIKPKVRVGTEWVNKGQNLEQVHWSVGAMAKGLYDRMFTWLIERCNKTLDAKAIPREYFIGVLDIAGFEIFDFNSFEQLWINFVNEKLQQFFNHHMFVLEQEEYKREGIQWTFIDFGLDLAGCIELIEKPLGIISVLDEQCIVPKATDLTFAQALNDQHLGKHPNFQKPKPPKGKQAEAHFAICHYAGTVRYNVMNWLEKNKDPLNDTVAALLKQSPNALLQACWANYTTQQEAAEIAKAGGGGGKKKGKSGAFQTVSMKYRESLNSLMHMLHQTHPHFIRCIIPNEKKASGVIDAALVLNQLTCNGVLEGIRICRKGFPNRMLYPDLKHRYSILASDEIAQNKDDAKKAGIAMLNRCVNEKIINEDDYRIGETKAFFKAGILGKLEEARDNKLSQLLTGLQARIRWYVALLEAKRKEEQRAGLLILQRNVRMWCLLRTWPWFKLYGQVKPLLKASKADEEMAALGDKMKMLEENLAKEEGLRKDAEAQNAKLIEEKNDLFLKLEAEKQKLSETEASLGKTGTERAALDKQVHELSDKVSEQEDKISQLNSAKRKVEQEAEGLRKNIQDLELNVRKGDSERQSKDHQIKSLQDEMAQQDESIAKLNKEKKHQEEVNRKLMDDLQAEEDKVNHLNKVKAKLEQTLDELEDSLEREKRAKQEQEKHKRKVEGELKVAQENIDELNKQKHDLESANKKKDQELAAMNSKLEDEQGLVSRLQKQIKELQGRVSELEEELDSERQSRSKSEKGKADLQRELDELADRLDEAGGATAAQIELNKKREAEMAKIRRDLEEAHINHESQLAALRKKHNDAVAEMGEQLDQVQKAKAKVDKEKATLTREIEDLHSAMDLESKHKGDAEKLAKGLELQVAELQTRCDEQNRQLSDFQNLKSRLNQENADLNRQLEDLESQLAGLHRLKTQINSQLEEAKRSYDDESKEKSTLAAQLRNLEHEVDSLREQLDEEGEAKAELQRQLSKSHAEIQQWKAKFESEGIAKLDEVEEAKRKLSAKVVEVQEQLEQANVKIASLEKARHKLLGELDDAQVDVERANSYANQLEKKQKEFDRVVDEWRRKVDDLHAELDNSQRDNRNLSTEVFRLKSTHDELAESVEGLRRENKNLAQEIKDLTDQLGEGGRSVHELQKMVRRLEIEKDELQSALDEAESSLEAEESKVLRAQVEVAQIRQEIEKRIQEKEEEFENTRKNHQRALDSMQATLESEAKGRAEALRLKKKLEQDINELEIALDHANKANMDAQKNIKRHQDQIRELQMAVEEEQRVVNETRDHLHSSEQRCVILQSEKDEAVHNFDASERSRRQLEGEVHDAREHMNEAQANAASLNSVKRKLEGELQALHAELDESLNELKAADDRAKKAGADAARLAEELRQEQEHAQHIDRNRKGLEQQVKEMQIRLDEAEAAALKGGKKIIAKLETRVRELELEVDNEQRRFQDCEKNMRKYERRVKEVEFMLEEHKKGEERTQEVIEKLQGKLKTYKRQIEEAEEVAATNLAKYRQLQQQYDDAEERADVAENSLSKLRAKNRSTVSVSGATLSHSLSVSHVRHSSSHHFES